MSWVIFVNGWVNALFSRSSSESTFGCKTESTLRFRETNHPDLFLHPPSISLAHRNVNWTRFAHSENFGVISPFKDRKNTPFDL